MKTNRSEHRRQGYLVFAGRTYYPGGGWNDLLGCFEDEATAVTAIHEWAKTEDPGNFWAHIVHDGRVVVHVFGDTYDPDAETAIEREDGS